MTRVVYGYLVAGLIDVLAAAAILSFPYVAKYLGLGTLGTIANSIFALCYVAVCLLVAKVRIFRDRRTYLVLGCLLIAAGGLLLFLNKSAASMLVSSLFYGLGAALFYPALQPWITEGMDKRRIVHVMGGYSIAWVVGYLSGPFLAGFVLSAAKGSAAGLEGPLNVIFGVSAIVAFLTAAFCVPDIYSHDVREKKLLRKEKRPPHRTDVPQERIRMFLILLWINNFAAFFLTGLIRFLFTELGKAEHIDPLVVGSVTTVLFFTIIPVTLLLRHWHGWIFSFRWLVGFQLLAVPAVLFLAFTTSVPLYFAAAVLFGILSAFSFFASASYSLMVGPSKTMGPTAGQKETSLRDVVKSQKQISGTAPLLEGKKDTFININEAIIGGGGFLSAFAGYLLAQFVSVKSGFLPGLAVVVLGLGAQAAVYYRLNPRAGKGRGR